MTSSDTGININKDKSVVTSVVMGNKEVEKITIMRDLSNIVCDNQRNENLKVKSKNMAVIPKCAFNLFSLTKLLINGWKLEGYKSYKSLKKDRFEIKFKFSILVNTAEGIQDISSKLLNKKELLWWLKKEVKNHHAQASAQ